MKAAELLVKAIRAGSCFPSRSADLHYTPAALVAAGALLVLRGGLQVRAPVLAPSIRRCGDQVGSGRLFQRGRQGRK